MSKAIPAAASSAAEIHQKRLRRYILLSILASGVVIGLKLIAYLVTGSVGLLSDTLESLSNVVSALIALVALTLAARPADADHEYGHGKIEYISSSAQAGMILITAVSIVAPSVARLVQPQPIDQVGYGTVLATASALITLAVSLTLRRAGRLYRSIALEGEARQMLVDVFTTIGVIVGVIAASLTGWQQLDPLIGLAIGGYVVYSGIDLLRRSALGLTDSALPNDEHMQIKAVLGSYKSDGVEYHALRTRQAGALGFMTVHILVPGGWTIRQGHALSERIERDIQHKLPHVHVTTHIEPAEDASSWQDVGLERPAESFDTETLP